MEAINNEEACIDMLLKEVATCGPRETQIELLKMMLDKALLVQVPLQGGCLWIVPYSVILGAYERIRKAIS